MKKKSKRTIAGGLVALGTVIYVALGTPGLDLGQNGADPDVPQTTQTTEAPASTKNTKTTKTIGTSSTEVSSNLEIPAATGGRIVKHGAYVTSYNTETLIPDWVAYELTAEEASGRRDRDGTEFRMDPDLKGVTQAMREDYSGSGWTKGHMMPAADAATTSTTFAETFYFTNICPQNETLNAGDWQYLEKRVRSWAKRYGSVFVVTGPIVGTNKYGTIGERDVVIPDSFYKALLVKREDGSYSAIAFVMDNDDERYMLKDCSMSINDLETLTGIDFFPGLDDRIEEKVEASVKRSDWGIK